MKIGDVGFAYRRVGGKLDRRPGDERPGSHYHLIFIARHVPSERSDIAVDGRCVLYRAHELCQLLFGVEFDRSDDVAADRSRFGHGVISEHIERSAEEHARLDRLSGDVRRKEKALIELAISVCVRADFTADRRRSQSIGRLFDERLFAADITARGRDASARIFDERTRHEVDPDRDRLDGVNKFAVTIVAHHYRIGSDRFDKVTELPYLLHGQRVAPFVTARPADKDDLYAAIHERLLDSVKIEFAVFERNAVVNHAVIGKRAGAFAGDRLFERVVRLAADRQQHVARTQKPEQRGGQRMRARDDLRRHDRALRPESVREHARESVTSYVVIAVSVGLRKMTLPDIELVESVQHLGLIGKRDCVNVREVAGYLLLRFLNESVNLFIDLLHFLLRKNIRRRTARARQARPSRAQTDPPAPQTYSVKTTSPAVLRICACPF